MSERSRRVPYDAWPRPNSSHPGRHIHPSCMQDSLGAPSLTADEAADRIGASRVTLPRLLNGRSGVSASVALKLEAAGWGTADA